MFLPINLEFAKLSERNFGGIAQQGGVRSYIFDLCSVPKLRSKFSTFVPKLHI